MGRLDGKTAIITGGSSGLGAATARRFVEEGAKVALADINDEKGQKLADEIGAAFLHLDVTQEEEWDGLFAKAEAALGAPVNVLVNSAGISIPSNIEQATMKHWRKIMSINLDGTFMGCRAAVRAMRPVAEAGGRCAIVNFASSMGMKAGSAFAAYGASKAAIRHLSKTTALHCGEQGLDIRCNTVLPGAIHTEMFDQYIEQGMKAGATEEQVIQSFATGHMAGRIGKPVEVADMVLFLSSDEAGFCTGADYLVDSGFTAG